MASHFDIPIVFHEGKHVPARSGYTGKPNAEKYWAMRTQIKQICKKHGSVGPNGVDDPVYYLIDTYGNEFYCIFLEVCEPAGLTKEWLAALLKRLKSQPKWSVAVRGIPEGYLLVYGDAIWVCGPTFKGVQSFDELLARGRQALHLDDLLRKCSTDRELQELAQCRQFKSKVIARMWLNDVTDAGLLHLANLPRIQSLGLGDKVSNRGLSQLAPLREVSDLVLIGARITDLRYLPVLPRLKVLNLDSSRITDAGLSPLRKQTSLAELDLARTKIGARGLAHLAALPRLHKLCLDGCRVDHAAVRKLQAFPRLRNLGLASASITDNEIVSLSECPLTQLDLRWTKITDACLPYLARMNRLQYLGLQETRISTPAKEALRQALPKCQVSG